MSDNMVWNSGSALLQNVYADYDRLTGGTGETTSTGSSGGSSGGSGGVENGPLAGLLRDISSILRRVSDMLENGGGRGSGSSGSTGSTGSGGSTGDADEVIAGTGRIWGDPHFDDPDGGKFDVQGQAGKTYNLLSDQNFQMNGRFDAWGDGGATAVGQVGISSGSDQVMVDKDGTVMVNGRELEDGERVELEDGGFVQKDGDEVIVKAGEYTVDFTVHEGSHLDMNVTTENANSDGVKPHGLLGQTFDGGEVNNGATGSGAQGEGAIDGDVTQYEVDNIYDRNFENYNQFFDDVEENPDSYSSEMNELLTNAFQMLGTSMMLLAQMMSSERAAA